MVTELKITRVRGGNHHPLSVRGFILDYLSMAGEQYIAEMHRAYKAELNHLAAQNGRRPYHKPVYHSMEMAVQRLTREGLIEFSGREEESDSLQFANWDVKPMRRYYRLATGGPSLNGHEDGHKLALGTRDGHDRDTTGTNGREAAHAQNGRSRPIAKPGKPPTI